MQDNTVKYRHEFKYPISVFELNTIKYRLDCSLKKDRHTGDSGMYNISSLYFDDYYDSYFNDNEVGSDPREKFRIRIYNHDVSRISLECKRKERGKTLKKSCLITNTQVESILNNERLVLSSQDNYLLHKFEEKRLTTGLIPKVIVEYDRIPYVCESGNVRITLDMNLTSSRDTLGFLGNHDFNRPVMPAGQHLLEVKYDEYLPDFIYKLLNLDSLTQMAYSKYYLCRKYYI